MAGAPPRSIPARVTAAMATQAAGGQTVTGQAIRWVPANWTTPSLRAAAERIADHASPVTDGESLISRQHVFDIVRAAEDPLDGFLAAMIWGHGMRGYGSHRVETILATAGKHLRPRLDGIAAAARTDAAAAWDAFTDTHKLRGLGPAFASKYAYFAAFADGPPAVDRPALIVDANTSWAMWDLIELARSVERRDGYLDYVTTAAAWARDADVRVDTIEWALFDIGKDVPRR